MKVWLLLSRFENGGLERVQVNLAAELIARGVNVSLIVGSIADDMRRFVPANIPVESIAARGKWLFPIGLFLALKHHQPDVVITTSNDIACLTLALRACAFPDVRVVVAQHQSASAQRTLSRGLKRIRLGLLRLLMARTYPSADSIIAVSHAVALDMRNELSLTEDAIDVIHNPVITPGFDSLIQAPMPWPWSDLTLPTIIFVGRLSPEKRVDLLVQAFHLLRADISARLLIVGAGPQERLIASQIAALGLSDDCRLTGYLPNAMPMIHRSDVLVLPSDYEGFGMVLVEAMACGVQIVATDCPEGPAEVLDYGRYGQLVPRGDARAMATAIKRSLSGECTFSRGALSRRSHEFTLARSADAYLAKIRQAFSQQRGE